MGVYKKSVITEMGEALAARAVSGEATIQFSHAKTSSYTYPEGTNLKKLTDLQEVKQTVIPVSYTHLNVKLQKLPISSLDADADFLEMEVGFSYTNIEVLNWFKDPEQLGG